MGFLKVISERALLDKRSGDLVMTADQIRSLQPALAIRN